MSVNIFEELKKKKECPKEEEVVKIGKVNFENNTNLINYTSRDFLK